MSKQKLLQLFLDGTFHTATLQDVARFLGVSQNERKRLLSVLEDLCEEGKLFQTQRGKFGTPRALGLIKGTLSGNERGFAFLLPDERQDGEGDYFVPHRNLHGALHQDTVLAKRIDGDEVEVVRILQRGCTTVVGTFVKDRRCGTLIPDDKKFFTDIFIPWHTCFQIKDGVKAVARVTEYPQGKAPGGVIVEVLGDGDDFFAEELSIIRSFNLHEKFPAHVEKEALTAQAKGITDKDLQGRKDFRDQPIVTIDGEDTRDIDDAICLQKTDKGYVLGVHIADVSHYVPRFSALDKEAFERGTSVYFPDRVLPMLPKALSNGICSLNEGEDRLTLSCLMTINKKGVVTDREIVPGIIRSRHKMTYNQISKILDGDKETENAFADVKEQVFLFAELTRILQTMRDKKGNVTLEVKEAKILYEDGEITIPDYQRPFSYQIIEAFMVLANETVAEYMSDLQAPFIYRVHEKPSAQKAEDFSAFACSLGLQPRFDPEDVKPYDYQKLLQSAENLPVYPVLNRVMLRSMQKAKYSEENVGHFGLASKCYCHFTSPIRRYPDLCIHRIIKEIIGGRYASTQDEYGDFVAVVAEQSSKQERNAADAEREVDALYTTMYMSERIGKIYDGVVSGVTNFGVFVELPNTIEGLIPTDTLKGTYECVPEKFLLKGDKLSFAIGEQVRVRVEDVDFERRRTIFRFLEKPEQEKQI